MIFYRDPGPLGTLDEWREFSAWLRSEPPSPSRDRALKCAEEMVGDLVDREERARLRATGNAAA